MTHTVCVYIRFFKLWSKQKIRKKIYRNMKMSKRKSWVNIFNFNVSCDYLCDLHIYVEHERKTERSTVTQKFLFFSQEKKRTPKFWTCFSSIVFTQSLFFRYNIIIVYPPWVTIKKITYDILKSFGSTVSMSHTICS